MENIVISNMDWKENEEWVKIKDTEFGALMVKTWIPYEKKIEAAKALAVLSLQEDAEAGVMSRSPYYEMYRDFVYIASYTNISSIEGQEDNEDMMETTIDWLISIGIYDSIMDIGRDDMDRVERIANALMNAYQESYKAINSSVAKVIKAITALSDANNLDSLIDKAGKITMDSQDALKMFNLTNDKDDTVPEIEDGVLNIGGRKISIRKVEK